MREYSKKALHYITYAGLNCVDGRVTPNNISGLTTVYYATQVICSINQFICYTSVTNETLVSNLALGTIAVARSSLPHF